MNIIKNHITKLAFEWSDKEKGDKNSVSGFILRYIESKKKLRDAQVEALKIYLWLKNIGNNKPLLDIFKEHYSDKEGNRLTTLLVDIANELDNKKLAKYAKEASDEEIEAVFDDLFGGYRDISNVLFSLPMGAGKTFVMAAMIYIDLYFNLNNDDDRFAKNFLIFAPSGLKSSVIPSLRTIERFDASWILPPDVANQIKSQMKFVVLDQNKTQKKSNRIENPNARKVQECLNQANPQGYVFVTNAEKVILDKIIFDPNKGLPLFEIEEDEKSRLENELRDQLSMVPRLSILIDEVHHTQNEENKLRAVINNQFNRGNTINIIGFTGTPYFRRNITVDSMTLTLDQIPNTIYHYELKNGVRNFLKQPVIKSFSSTTEVIVKSALDDFYNKFYNQEYLDGRKPKLAIYCSDIQRLHGEILPLVLEFYSEKGLNTDEVFWFHGDSKAKTKTGETYKLGKDADIEFSKLDTPYSKKRIILLVQIGKEGWDCQSLSGVVLSGEGDSPKNMVLQTSSRCLREVDDASKEIGLIYLNQGNYRHLERELSDNHKITVKEFEEGKEKEDVLLRADRRKYLKLPPLEYKQLKIKYELINEQDQIVSEVVISNILNLLRTKENPYFIPEITTSREGLDWENEADIVVSPINYFYQKLSFSQFKNLVIKSSLGHLTYSQFKLSEILLHKIYQFITEDNSLKSGFQLTKLIADIHSAIIPQASVRIHESVEPESVNWLISDVNTNPILDKAKIYPDNIDFINKIPNYDKNKTSIAEITAVEDEKIKQFELTKKVVSGDAQLIAQMDAKIEEVNRSKLPVKNKDRSFHYIPYEFASKLEKDILEHIFKLGAFQSNQLEVYFNGDRFLSTFKIKIYKKINDRWKLIQDRYTPDFLIIKRSKNRVEKTLIIETKGAHLSQDFSDIKDFMENTFIGLNKQKYDFLYLQDGKDMDYHYQAITDRINKYFIS